MSDEQSTHAADPLGAIVADDHPVAKAFEMVVAGHRTDGKSTQPAVKESAISQDLCVPPLPLESLAALSSISGTRSSCIEAIARNTVGLGVTAVPRDDNASADDKTADKAAELIRLLDALARRDMRLDRPAFLDLLFAAKTDEEEVGQGLIEISRNKTTGQIDGIFHLPAKRMRRLKDRSGWRLLNDANGAEGVEFYNFGEKLKYNDDGTATTELAASKSWDKNEVMVFRLYSSESRDYGMPRDAAIALEYAADKLAAESNVSFFDSSGVPPTIIFVAGEEASSDGQRTVVQVTPGTIKDIAETVKSDSGHSKTVAIVPLPPGAKPTAVVLGQRSDRDVGNNEFRMGVSGRIRSAFRLGPIFIAEDSEGRYDAEVQRALGLEQVFDPEQRRWEGALDMLIDELGYDDLRLNFKRLAVESDEARRTSANDAAQVRAITNREYRKAHGLGPLPEHSTDDEDAAKKEGKVPKGWNDRLVDPKSGLAVPGDRPFGGRNGSDPIARKDNSGLAAGVGGRRPTPGPGGTSDPALQKSEHGNDDVDFEATELEVQYLELTDGAIDRAMTRTHTVADIIAGAVVDAVERRDAERVGAGAA